jgi:uncharacterized membrane protein
MVQAAARRREYLDWLRGVAVLVMIEAHTLDAWTLPADRASAVYKWAIIIGGMGGPLFLLLAGVSVALAATSRAAVLGTDAAAAATVRRRGVRIFLYAFLFRLQSFMLSPGSSLWSLLKVDILNVMGPSIVFAALLWQALRGWGARLLLFGAATATIAMVTPLARASPLLQRLPDPVEWYFRPVPGRTNFTLFPWAGFVTAGAAAGVWLARTPAAGSARRPMVALGATGLAIALAGYSASYLPPMYPQTNFWTSSPTFFFLRAGLLVLAIAVAWAWERLVRRGTWSPLRILGRESLFVYWIHVEMVYGLLTSPLHRRLPLPWAIAAFLVFTLLMLGAVGLKHRVEVRLRRRPVPATMP